MNEAELKYFKLSSFPKIKEAIKESVEYSKLSAAYTYPRTISEPYTHRNYWNKMIWNIIKGKVPEYLVKQYLLSQGVNQDLDEGQTPYFTEDFFDISLVINGNYEEWDVKNLSLFSSFELSDWKKLDALIPVQLSNIEDIIACQNFNKMRESQGKTSCKNFDNCKKFNKCLISGQWHLRDQPIKHQSKRYLMTFSYIPDLEVSINDKQSTEFKKMYEEYKEFEKSIPNQDKYHPKRKIAYMIENFEPSILPNEIKSIDIKIQQLDGVVLIAGVADETNYPKFKVSVPPNIMKRNETLLHYTTIPNMKLSIQDLRPLSNLLPEV